MENRMPLLVTDFDGVICDSAWESVLTGYNMYLRMQQPGGRRVTSLEEIPRSVQLEFRRLRAYLHGAEDFLPIMRAVHSDRPIHSEADFNYFRDNTPEETELARKLFYAERDYLRQHERTLWLELNPLFPGIGEAFGRLHPFENVHVLTTKRLEDVMEILHHYGIEFPKEQINAVDTTEKFTRLTDIANSAGCELRDVIYIEDQINFLPPALAAGAKVYLAGWGYVSPEQRQIASAHSIPIIESGEYAGIVRDLSRA
jgi:phosphoglycolate phosphatase-like HAD superfamily hydrolase